MTAADHGAEERRRRSLAARIAEGDQHLRIAVSEKIVEVAADFARRAQSDGDFETGHLGRFRRQQHGLQFEGGAQIFLHAPLALADFLVEPRIFDRDRDRRRQQAQRARMVFGEISDALAFQIHHADDAILHDQRHGDFASECQDARQCSADRPWCRGRAPFRATVAAAPVIPLPSGMLSSLTRWS